MLRRRGPKPPSDARHPEDAEAPTRALSWTASGWSFSSSAAWVLVAAGMGDLIYGQVKAQAGWTGVRDAPMALLYLVALLLPFALVLGLSLASLGYLLRNTPWLAPLVTRLGSRREIFRPSRRGFATALAAGAGFAFAVVALWRLAKHFATHYHDASLAAAAMAASALGVMACATLLTAALALILRPVARLLGRFACVGAALALMAGTLGAIIAHVFRRLPALLELVGPFHLGLGLGGVLCFFALSLWRRRGRVAWDHAGRALGLLGLFAAGLLVFAGLREHVGVWKQLLPYVILQTPFAPVLVRRHLAEAAALVYFHALTFHPRPFGRAAGRGRRSCRHGERAAEEEFIFAVEDPASAHECHCPCFSFHCRLFPPSPFLSPMPETPRSRHVVSVRICFLPPVVSCTLWLPASPRPLRSPFSPPGPPRLPDFPLLLGFLLP